MSDIYLRSTDGSDADTGATWALAKATLNTATNGALYTSALTPGDKIFVSKSHSETYTANASFAGKGTAQDPIYIIGVDDTGDPEPPTTLATTTKPTWTMNASANFSWVDFHHLTALKFAINPGFTGAFMFSGSAGTAVSMNQCAFDLGNGSTNLITLGSGGAGYVDVVDCVVKTGHSGQRIRVDINRSHIKNLSFDAGSTALGSVFSFATGTHLAVIEDCDFSNIAHSALFESGINVTTYIVMRRCKLHASTALTTGTHAGVTGLTIILDDVDSGSTNYKSTIKRASGSISTETTLVRSGGADHLGQAISWKMVTDINACYAWPLISKEIYLQNSTTGTSMTVTAYILHDSTTALTNADIWLEVEYHSDSGSPLGNTASGKAGILATPTNHASSTETWTTTGMTNPNKQQLTVTFTPQKAGMLACKVRVAKPSYTLYVCPKLVVS